MLAVVVIAGGVVIALGGDGDDEHESSTRGIPEESSRRIARVGASCERFGGLTHPSIVRRAANIEAGPLIFVSLGEYARQPARDFEPVRRAGETGQNPRYFAHKVIVVMRDDRDATVVIPRAERTHASLLWGRTPGITLTEERMGWAQIADGNPAVRFKGCAGRFMEYVGGGFVIAGARCLPLDVWIEGENVPRRVSAAFGSLERCA